MTAEQYLTQLRFISKKIESKKRDAELWRTIAEGANRGRDSDKVQSSPSQDLMAEAIARAVDYEKEAQMLTWRLINLQHDVILKLDNMTTADYGILLSDYYVHGMSLTDIANEWDISYRHVKRMKPLAIAEFDRLFGSSLRNFGQMSPNVP